MTATSTVGDTEDPHVQKRRWHRHSLDVPVRVVITGADKTKFYDGRGNAVSEGGMAVTAGVELKVGESTAIEFTPPYSGPPIRVRGIVRNRKGYCYGIEFLVDRPEEQEQVSRLRGMLQTFGGQ